MTQGQCIVAFNNWSADSGNYGMGGGILLRITLAITEGDD